MALQGNPFAGKLKVRAPDLGKIPSVEAQKDSVNIKSAPNEATTDNSAPLSRISADAPKIDDLNFGGSPPRETDISEIHQRTTSESLAINKQNTSKSPANNELITSTSLANHQHEGNYIDNTVPNTRPGFKKDKSLANHQHNGSTSLANHQQITSEPLAINKQPLVDEFSTASKSPAVSPANLLADRQQSASNLPTASSITFLQGIQRKLAEFIYIECRDRASRITRPIAGHELANYAQCDKKTAKNAADRLVEKTVIKRIQSYPGRLGSTIYEMSEIAYKEFLEFEKRPASKLFDDDIASKLPAKLPAQMPATSSSSSSHSLYMSRKLTTEQEPMQNPKSDLPTEWLEIDFSQLIEFGLRLDDRFEFGNKQLFQWFSRNYCTAKEAQESINHFTFQLKNAKKEDFHKGPFVYFMGTMARDHYFNRPDGYVSPEEAALKRRAEDMRRKNENTKRLQEEIFEEVFEAWFNTLNGNDVNALAPHFTGHDKKKLTIKVLFRDQHWMTIRDNPCADVTQLRVLGQRDIDQSNQDDMEIMKLTDAIRTLKGALDSPNLDSPNRLRFQDTLQLKLTERRSFINSKQELIDKYAEIDAYDSESHSLNLTDHLTQTI